MSHNQAAPTRRHCRAGCGSTAPRGGPSWRGKRGGRSGGGGAGRSGSGSCCCGTGGDWNAARRSGWRRDSSQGSGESGRDAGSRLAGYSAGQGLSVATCRQCKP